MEDATTPLVNQALPSDATPHTPVTSAQPSLGTQQKQNPSTGRPSEPHTAPMQSSTPIIPIVPTKIASKPLNIVDQMRKANVLTRIHSWNYYSKN